jgi:glutamate carboxypeptidase
MPTASTRPFDTDVILDGIRRWVEIETPTDAPDQVNELATLVAEGYRDLPAAIEPRTRLLHRLYQTLR